MFFLQLLAGAAPLPSSPRPRTQEAVRRGARVNASLDKAIDRISLFHFLVPSFLPFFLSFFSGTKKTKQTQA